MTVFTLTVNLLDLILQELVKIIGYII